MRGAGHHAYKHGHAGRVDGPPSKTYTVWAAMLQRCYLETSPNFPRYGGRGIKVCDRWHSFENFLADMGERPPGLSIERENVNGDYGPSNCSWATRAVQANNTRANVRITIEGVTKTLSQWCAETGVNKHTAAKRINRSGWTPQRAVTTPALWSW